MTENMIPNADALDGWRKSSYSGPEAGSCVEIADGYPPGVPVRDSKKPDGPALIFSQTGWSSFIAAVKGEGFLP